MATINLGNIKFNWKGTYNAGTAYAVDDVVSYNGSSYVCILASTGNLPTNTTYWNVMSEAGTDGTDLTSTLTTQGDIVYRDASGLARLGAGTNGQALITGGTGANPSWGTISGASNAFFAYDFSSTSSGDLVFATELFDDGGNYNTSNGRYTCPSAGKYLLQALAYSAQDNAGNEIYFKKNGSTFAGGGDGFAYSYSTHHTTPLQLIVDASANDYFNVHSTNNVYGNYCYFMGVKLY